MPPTLEQRVSAIEVQMQRLYDAVQQLKYERGALSRDLARVEQEVADNGSE